MGMKPPPLIPPSLGYNTPNGQYNNQFLYPQPFKPIAPNITYYPNSGQNLRYQYPQLQQKRFELLFFF